MTTEKYKQRPARLRRTWMFVSGLDSTRQHAAILAGADVVVADLEEFTQPQDRPEARLQIVSLMHSCRDQGVVGAVRVNKLDEDGCADLEGVMPGRPDAVFLPHVETAEQIVALDTEITRLETLLDLPRGATEIVPTIESAKGLLALASVLQASTRIKHALLSAEDFAASLGAERGLDGIELQYARGRFLLECVAVGCLPIDCPFTFRAVDALKVDLAVARRLGFKAKCVVFPEQVLLVNHTFTPSELEVDEANRLVQSYELQASQALTNITEWVDAPRYNNARRLLARHDEFCQFDTASSVHLNSLRPT